jgi:hypothetical protein
MTRDCVATPMAGPPRDRCTRELPPKVEAQLELLVTMKANKVRKFAARQLGETKVTNASPERTQQA